MNNDKTIIHEKALALINDMTLDQKIAQLQCMILAGQPLTDETCKDGVGELAFFSMTEGVEQLAQNIQAIKQDITKKGMGIPPLLHCETLTGVNAPQATVFPSAIGLGATFEPELIRKMGDIIRKQMLALGYRQALAPVLDVCRDSRWGRIGETYGEDPTLNAAMGVAYVKGIQADKINGICATGKHFLGYGVSSGGLNMATNPIPMREIREVYAKPFQAAITEAGLMSIMNSYGTIDGDMVIGSNKILTELLRNEMEFEGIVISDYMSVEHLVDHRLAADLDEAGQIALKAGLDVECPMPSGYKTENLCRAIKNGTISETLVDQAAIRVIETKLQLGLMESESIERNGADCFMDSRNEEYSYHVAQKSIVLLKNDGILPLNKKKKKIAVIGPHVDNVRYLFGCYTYAASVDMSMSGPLSAQAGMEAADLGSAFELSDTTPKYANSKIERDNPNAMSAVEECYPNTPTILTALQRKAPECDFVYVRGCDVGGEDRSGFEDAVAAAMSADVVLMVLGGKYGWGGSCTVGEGIDMDQIGLSGVQEELALRIMETGKPTVVAHMDARPLSSVKIAEQASAILEFWFPGTSGGKALADVLFGDYNPAGRLSATAARHVGQLPIYTGQYIGNSYYMDKCATNSCRYLDSTSEPLYYFGHGLSYTTFSYHDLCVDERVDADGEVNVSCKVTNIGSMDGEEVVQLYVSDEIASMLRPYKEFAGFTRVSLKAGETKTITFTMRADQFAFVGKDEKWIVEEGAMTVYLGGSSNSLPLKGQFYINNTAYVRPAVRGFYAKTTVK